MTDREWCDDQKLEELRRIREGIEELLKIIPVQRITLEPIDQDAIAAKLAAFIESRSKVETMGELVDPDVLGAPRDAMADAMGGGSCHAPDCPSATTIPWKSGGGRELRARREALSLRLEDLAKKTGISIGHLSRFERGDVSTSVPSLYRIAVVLGFDELAATLEGFIVKAGRE